MRAIVAIIAMLYSAVISSAMARTDTSTDLALASSLIERVLLCDSSNSSDPADCPIARSINQILELLRSGDVSEADSTLAHLQERDSDGLSGPQRCAIEITAMMADCVSERSADHASQISGLAERLEGQLEPGRARQIDIHARHLLMRTMMRFGKYSDAGNVIADVRARGYELADYEWHVQLLADELEVLAFRQLPIDPVALKQLECYLGDANQQLRDQFGLIRALDELNSRRLDVDELAAKTAARRQHVAMENESFVRCMAALGRCYSKRNEPEKARRMFSCARRNLERVQSPHVILTLEICVAELEHNIESGQFDEDIRPDVALPQPIEKRLSLATRIIDGFDSQFPIERARLANSRGIISRLRGDLVDSTDEFGGAAVLCRDEGEYRVGAEYLANLAGVMAGQGHRRLQQKLHELAIAWSSTPEGSDEQMREQINQYANFLVKNGEHAKAVQLITQTTPKCSTDAAPTSPCELSLSVTYNACRLLQGDVKNSRQRFTALLSHLDEIEVADRNLSRQMRYGLHRWLSTSYELEGDVANALHHMSQVCDSPADATARCKLVFVRDCARYIGLLTRGGDSPRAEEVLQHATAVGESLNNPVQRRKAESMLKAVNVVAPDRISL